MNKQNKSSNVKIIEPFIIDDDDDEEDDEIFQDSASTSKRAKKSNVDIDISHIIHHQITDTMKNVRQVRTSDGSVLTYFDRGHDKYFDHSKDNMVFRYHHYKKQWCCDKKSQKGGCKAAGFFVNNNFKPPDEHHDDCQITRYNKWMDDAKIMVGHYLPIL